MKELFPGYFSKSDKSHKDLWAKCIFVFDTNILLNLYRYSDETTSQFLQILELLKDRSWIPYRVAKEYLDNRLKVIDEQQEKYTATLAEVQALNGKLEHPRQHPFVSNSTMEKVQKSLQRLKEELEINKEAHTKRIIDDDIKEKLSTIFEHRVGSDISNHHLEEIIKEGEKRYEEKIPPGFADVKKSTGETSLPARCRPYGDLIIWKSIIAKCKTETLPVIFVTDDGKEDWWLRFKGKTIGPRPELIKEFNAETGMDFHMYQPERFLFLAGEFLKEKTSEETLEEIRELREKKYYSRTLSEKTSITENNTTEAIAAELDRILTRKDMERDFAMLSATQRFLTLRLRDLLSLRKSASDSAHKLRDMYEGHDIEDAVEYQQLKSECVELDSKIFNAQTELKKTVKLISELSARMAAEEELSSITSGTKY